MNSKPATPAGRLVARGSHDRSIEVVFNRTNDRYTHHVVLKQGSETRTLLTAVEGHADEPWPPSPALQQLSIEEREDSHVALLVGMAGRSHYSAGIEAMLDEGCIQFDLACRLHLAPPNIGSTYQATLPLAPDFLATDPAISEVVWQQDVVSVRPTVMDTPPATIRWRFSIQLPPVETSKSLDPSPGFAV